MARVLMAPIRLAGLLGLFRGAHASGFCHMFYVNADTNLERYQVGDMGEVLELSPPSDFTALLYMDRNDGSSSGTSRAMDNLYYSNGQRTTSEISTSIYAKLMNNPSHGSGKAWVIQQEPGNGRELDSMAKSAVLDFVRWGWANCGSATHHVISFNMHGGGVSGISGDDSNGHSGLSVSELQEIFQQLYDEGKKFDIIGFDTCLMSAYSLAQVLWPLSDYLIASEPTEPGYGWDYTQINTRASSPLQYAESIVSGFLSQRSGPNQLVVTDLAKFGEFVAPMKAFMQKLSNGVLAGDQRLVDSITRARENTAEYAAVWEVFVDWFEISDVSGAQEKSQMDLGSFFRHLKTQCTGLGPDVDQLLPKLEATVLYRKQPGSIHLSDCTGPGCAAGAEGVALFFKKRRWMLGAYEYYARRWNRPTSLIVAQLGPFVDDRLDKEIKEGLPDWYRFLSAYYTFAPKSSGVNTCGGTAAGTQSVPTCGGTANGDLCMFPFSYGGVTYNDCTTTGYTEKWCYTDHDANWGNCDCESGGSEDSPALAKCSGATLCNEVSITGDTSTTTVKLPSTGSQYSNGLSGSITITGPSTATFAAFDLESPLGTRCYDYLLVNSKKYCGSNNPGTFEVASSLEMTFHSDSSYSGSGFQITVTGHSGATSAEGRRRRSAASNTGTEAECPSDGVSCSLSAACTCPMYYVQQTYTASSGEYCYGCIPSAGRRRRTTTSTARRRRTAPACPGPTEPTCTLDSTCRCDAGFRKAQYSCGDGCRCWGCDYARRLSAPAAREDPAANASLPTRGNKLLGAANLSNIEAFAVFPSSTYVCSDTEPLCNVQSNKEQGGDYVSKGDIASWVTSVDMYIGTDSTDNDLSDVTWTMRVPTYFPSATTFLGRWPSKIPYIISANDECQAFLRVDGAVDVFSQPELCAVNNITLAIPVSYYATEADIAANKYENGMLEMEVTCSDFTPMSALKLQMPRSDQQTARHVPHEEGGFIQPLVYKGSSMNFSTATFSKCNSQGAMPWAAAPTVTLVDACGDRMRENVNAIYGQLITNAPVVGDNTTAGDRGVYSWRVSVNSCEISTMRSDDEESSSSMGLQSWTSILVVAACAALVCATAGYCYARDVFEKKVEDKPKRKNRGLKETPILPTAQPAKTERTAEVTPLLQPQPIAPVVPAVMTQAPVAQYMQMQPIHPMVSSAAILRPAEATTVRTLPAAAPFHPHHPAAPFHPQHAAAPALRVMQATLH